MDSTSKRTQLEILIEQMNVFTREPERYLSEQPALTQKIKVHTKTVYDTLKKHEPPNSNPESLPELIIHNFDDEQIWQEIELQNAPSVIDFISGVSKIIAAKDRLTFSSVENGAKNDFVSGHIGDHHSSDASESDLSELEEDLGLLHPDASDDSDADLERLLDLAEAKGIPEDEEDIDDELEKIHEEPSHSKSSKSKSSVADDKFFKLADMEAFLAQEDLREERRLAGKDDEDNDDGDDDDDGSDEEGEGRDSMYADFFSGEPTSDVKSKKRVTFEEEDKSSEEDEVEEDLQVRRKNLLDSDSEGEDADDIMGRKKSKSGFEERQEKMRKRIAVLEKASLAEKSWQMTGEVGGAVRPENSLLQEDLDFDHTSKLPPVITEKTTTTLEDLIKQRIKDKALDDVERKVKTNENHFEYKKRITLSQEKSKLSLSEIYAQEYLKQNEQAEDKEEEKDPKHEEIKNMMQSLFRKLDALSNFHYTPKPAIPDLKIVTNLPSVTMEEVAPVSVSDCQLLAPEEIKEKRRGIDKGKSERTDTDRLRERRLKKAEKRKRLKEKEKQRKLIDKANPGLGNKYSKEKAMKQLEKDAKSQPGVTVIKEKGSAKKSASSKQFFQQLQDEVTTHIKSKKPNKKKETKSSKNFML